MLRVVALKLQTRAKRKREIVLVSRSDLFLSGLRQVGSRQSCF
jgi:hypothetical protein